MSAELYSEEDEELRPPWEVGRLVGGKYRLTRILGYGGMGAVYAAEQTDLGRPVAIKALRPQIGQAQRASARLMREARTVARLQHPNIVDVFDVGVDEEVPYLVMELLQGEALGARLGRGRLTPADAAKILLPAMRGVSAAHAADVIHRDLKPDNLFLCLSDTGTLRRVLVLDFGISVDAQRAMADTRLTRSGTIVGTPRYMAPEQLAGEPIDARTDVYAFGAILYEMVTGVVPVDGDTFALLAAAKLSSRPEPPSVHLPDLDPGLEALILSALERDPAARPQSVEAFADAFAHALDNPGQRPARPGADRSRLLAAVGVVAAALVCVAAALSVFVVLRRANEPAEAPIEAERAADPTPPPERAPDPPPLLEPPVAPTPAELAGEPEPVEPVEPAPTDPAPELAETGPEEPEGPPGTETGEERAPTISRRSGRRPPGARTHRLTWDDF